MTVSSRGASRSIVYIGYLLAFCLLGGASALIFLGQERYRESLSLADRSYEALDYTSQLLVTIQRAEGSARGYALTGLAAYRQDALVNLTTVEGVHRALDSLLWDDPEQQINLRALDPLLARRLALVAELVRIRDRDQRVSPALTAATVASSAVTFPLRRALVQVTEHERRNLADRQAEAELRGQQTAYLVAGGLGFALIIVLAASSITFGELREREHAEERLRHEGTRQAVMIELQQAVATARPDDPAILDLIAEQVMTLTGAGGAAITFVEGDVHVARVAKGDLVPWLGVRNPLANTLSGAVLQRGEPEVIQDNRTDPRVDQRMAERLGTRSTAILPISSGDHGVGVLVVSSKVPNAFGADDLAALRILSGILSAGITNAAAAEANRRLVEDLRRSRDAAEEANQAKSAFLATMSHELRTPLNSVIGFANLLLKNRAGTFTAGDLQFLGRIRDNGTHLLGLINDILDVSKIEAGKMEVRPEPTDLAPLIRDTVAQLGGQASARGVELHAETVDGLAPAEVDPARLRQVLINLIGNGLKFTEKGSVTVRLVGDGQGHPLRIDVMDTGIGIPPDRLEAIFDAFTQAESTTERRFGGTGLGLTISRSLVRLMGADLTVSSVVGQGSTFSVVFATASGENTAGGGTGPLVLIVDDDVHTRQYLSAVLATEGYRFTTAREGRDALAFLTHQRPALILLDIKMPVMNGREFLRALRADPRYAGLPVVVITSLDADHPELQGVQAEVSRLFFKGPSLEEELPKALRELLGA